MRMILDVAVFLAVAIGILGGCGLLWRPLLPWRARPLLPLLAPFLGLALVSGICHALGAAGLPLARIAWLFIALAVAGWGTELVRRRLLRPRRELLAVVAVCALAFLLAALPLLARGYLTSVGMTSDAVAYCMRAEYLQHAPLGIPDAGPGQGFLTLVRAHSQSRAGDVYLLGLLGLLTGHRSFELLTLVMAFFFGLIPGSVFVWARLGLRLRQRSALLAAGLVGINNLLLWAVFDNFLSQVLALSLFPLLLVFGVEGWRQPDWRSAALFGALLATLVSMYPVYGIYAVATVGFYWLVAWMRAHRVRDLPRHAGWWLTAAGCAVVSNGVALYRSLRELGILSQLLAPQGAQFVGAGDILVFPSVLEIPGLSSHLASAMVVRLWPLPRGMTSLLGLAAALFALVGWWKLAPRLRVAAAALLLAGAALAAHQRFGVNLPEGYPYGYFKAVSILPMEAMVLLGAGLAAAWRRPALRVVTLLTVLAVVVLNLMNSLWSARYTFKNTLLTRDLIEVAQAPSTVPAGAWVMMDVNPSPELERAWIGYLWHDRLLLSARGAPLPAPLPFFRWAFVERQLDPERRKTSTEPWYDPKQYKVLWQTPRFVLRERRDALLGTLTWEKPLLGPGESFDVELAPERRSIAGKLAGRQAAAELAAGTPRRVQISAYGAGDAPARLEVDGAPPLTLGAGGWSLDLDLACRPSPPSIRVRNVGPAEVLVSGLQVLSSARPGAAACLDLQPLGTGAALVAQEVRPPRIRYKTLLWLPRDEDHRLFSLAVHVTDVSTSQPFGVWSLRFPGGKRTQAGTLEIDLSDGRSQAQIDGRPAPVDAVAVNLRGGSFGLSTVIWQVQPVAQLSVDNLMSFNRTAEGVISRANAYAHAPLTVIPSKIPAPP